MEKKKFEWASSVAVDALQPHVRELLERIAEITEQPGVAHAMVSDESWVGDFMPSYFSEDRILDYRKRVAAQTDPEQRKRGQTMLDFMQKPRPAREVVEGRLTQLAAEMGVAISLDDNIYEVAIRLRDK